MSLNLRYLPLLAAIQENPLGTLDELAKRAEMSRPTVAKRLEELQGYREIGDAKDKAPMKKYFYVNPLLNLESLGLELVQAFVEVKSYKKLETMEVLTTNHPYTSYRGRCYGYFNGLLLQFRIPQGTLSHLKEFLDSVIRDGIASNYEMWRLNDGRSTYTSMSVKGWKPEILTWDFDWKNWFEIKSQNLQQPSMATRKGESLDWLTRKDIHLMNEVMLDARRRNTEIISELEKQGYSITTPTFSRRYAQIRDQCFSGYRVSIDPAAFDIYTNLLITGRDNQEDIDTLHSRLQSHPIPFESILRTMKNELFWTLRIQANHLSALLSSLQTRWSEMKVSILDYSKTMRYGIWAEAFDENAHAWKEDREFMVNQVMDSIHF
ncbi:MAG: hypothetical protein ACFFEF_13700 [Candidatus Thorarchaeota archaeon]